MTRRSIVVRPCVVVIVGLWTVSPAGWAQNPREAQPRPDRAAAKSERAERAVRIESEADFQIWRQKAQSELEVLEAQIEAKKAEILLREAEHRAKKLAPDLAILTKLEEPISMSFPHETPLEDVLKYIKSASTGPHDSGIPIYVDPIGLQRARKTMTSPVVLDLEGVPLKTTLRLVLKQVGLTYTVKDGLLTITSESDD